VTFPQSLRGPKARSNLVVEIASQTERRARNDQPEGWDCFGNEKTTSQGPGKKAKRRARKDTVKVVAGRAASKERVTGNRLGPLPSQNSPFFLWKNPFVLSNLYGMRVAVLVLLFVPFLGGCLQGPSFGTPGRCGVEGRVVLPSCEAVSLGEGVVLAYNERGEVFQGFLGENGEFSIPSFSGSSCLVYVRWKNVQLAGGFYPLQKDALNDLGEITTYTTAQVLIYEAAHRLYPQAVYIRDIPHFLPPESFVDLVGEAIRSCRDPFSSPEVLREAQRLVEVWF